IRRACAEGLALLAASAISEDAVSIPSSIFASVVEIIDATGVDGKQRKAMEALSYAKSCALLTIGCLQRTSERHAQGKLKAFRHGSGSVLQRPTIRMLRSVLSYLSLDTTLLSVRICSLHSFELLISYLGDGIEKIEEAITTDNVESAILVLEETFTSVWSAIAADFDRGFEVSCLLNLNYFHLKTMPPEPLASDG
ncbi:MAG: hypothetical protein ACREBR_00265, partial [bacterium]